MEELKSKIRDEINNIKEENFTEIWEILYGGAKNGWS